MSSPDISAFEEDFEHDDCLEPITNTQLGDKLIKKLLDDDVDNEETLLELGCRDDFINYVLNPIHYNDHYLIGLTNLFRRLLKIDSQSINQWIGLEQTTDNSDHAEIVTIFSFFFKLIDHQTESFMYPELIKYKDLTFSLYDYVTSILCAFVMTLNVEQFEEIEEFLFDQLFSTNILRTLIASDIICCMCRVSKTFANEIIQLLFQMLSEIWFEDLKLSSSSSEKKKQLQILQLTCQIILNLTKRIFKFIDPQLFNQLLIICPIQTNFPIWNEFDLKVVNINLQTNSLISYEKIFNYTKFIEKPDGKIIYLLIRNFFNSKSSYDQLLLLRLLKNVRSFLMYSDYEKIIWKMKNIFQQRQTLQNENYRIELALNCLKVLNQLSMITNRNHFQKPSSIFMNNLNELLLILFEQCSNDYISKFYYFITLQNLICNEIFTTNLIENFLSKSSTIRTYLIQHLSYQQQQSSNKCLIQDENDIYMKQLFDNEHYNLPFEIYYKYDNEADFDDADFEIQEDLFDHLVQFQTINHHQNLPNDLNNEKFINKFRSLVENLKTNINLMDNILNDYEFMQLYNELNEIMVNNNKQ